MMYYISSISSTVKKSEEFHMLPMECLYLSRMSMVALAGHQPQPVKHFALKLKPKSAALRADLLQKCKHYHAMPKKIHRYT